MIRITLADVDAAAVRSRIAEHSAAEVAAICEPSGYSIVIEADAAEGSRATLLLGASSIPLGIATIDFLDAPVVGAQRSSGG